MHIFTRFALNDYDNVAIIIIIISIFPPPVSPGKAVLIIIKRTQN